MKNGSETDERLEFSWPGKREALEEALLPPTARLVPCPEESFHWDETENLYFEGDNLEVLRLLEGYNSGESPSDLHRSAVQYGKQRFYIR